MRRFTRLAAAPMLLAAATAASAASFKIKILVRDGDNVPGVGNITTIDNLAVNNLGHWIVESDTDNPDPNSDGVLLKNGALFLREGDALPVPAGASIDSFDSININDMGDSGWNLFLDGTSGTNDDSGVFVNNNIIIQESNIATAPQFSAGTPYIGWFEVKLNNFAALLMMSSVDDPAIPSTVDRAIVLVTPASLSQSVIAKEGDILTGQTDAVADFATTPHGWDFSDEAEVMFIADLDGSTATDGAIYFVDVFGGTQTLVAQEGQPSPVPGRNWMTISTSQRVEMNNNGDYVYSGTLDAPTTTDNVIIRNAKKFIQEGDTLPAIGGAFTFTAFGTGPIHIDDNRNVVWFGDWNDPVTTQDTGLFWNQTLVLQEGVTMVEGLLVTSVSGVQDGFELSDNGTYLIAEVQLSDGATTNIDAAVLVTICPLDIDGDGAIGQGDLGVLLASYGLCEGQAGYLAIADLNNDGCVDQADLGLLLAFYGQPCP